MLSNAFYKVVISKSRPAKFSAKSPKSMLLLCAIFDWLFRMPNESGAGRLSMSRAFGFFWAEKEREKNEN